MESIWIDALEFDNFGGFKADTQFVREMGQGYLLADGSGKTVAPAETVFTVKESGMYRMYIRTKNWIVGYEPDPLTVSVDGNASPFQIAEMQIRGWYFDIGGDFYLEAGKHLLTVSDGTGWFGRFAAAVITNDFDFVPSPEIGMMMRQRSEIRGEKRNTKFEGDFDFAVVGGGAAGVVAAIAAARHGLKTVLINDRPVLGGNSSDEAGVSLDGAACKGYHETGIIYEIKCVREAEHLGWSEAYKRFIEKEKNITLYNNMLVDGAETENGVITTLFAIQTYNLTRHSFNVGIVADATGDGWVGYYSGAKYRIGREARFQHNESLAPKIADLNTMSGCVMKKVSGFPANICCYCAEENAETVEFHAPEWAFRLPAGDALGREPSTPEKGEWWLENRNDYDDLWEQEFVRDELIRIAVGYFDWLKNSWKECHRAAKLGLRAIGSFNAKRESRRLIGDYILSQNDYTEDKFFPDSVLYTGWNLDVHNIKGIFSGDEGAFTSNSDVPLTPVPFRCLYSKNISNLMMAGRCISTTHMGMGSTRVQLTTATMGQAVGTAAYFCKKYGLTPREIGEKHIMELQQTLIKEDQTILGICNNDSEDMARLAHITADSYEPGGEPQNVAGGFSRPYKNEPYAWISKPGLPQSITLDLGTPSLINQVRITVEMPLDRHYYGFQPAPKPTETVKDFTVEIYCNGEWKQTAEIKNNIQRLIVIGFDTVKAEKVRINILKTHGSNRAIIPEIRIYNC